jgi:general L-amino acid transport system permease protein
VGVMRLSKNWLVAKVATFYIEFFRNVPLLLQIFIWYATVLKPLPGPKQALNMGDLAFLSNRGLMMPRPIFGEGAWLGLAGFVAAVIGIIVLRRWSKARQEATGQTFPLLWTSLALILLLPLIGFALAGFPVTWDVPALQGFNFQGGLAIIPEFMALLLALSVYTGAFIAEAVRAGIQAVSHGQSEAANALGLRNGPTLRLVVIPQALRIIIPPLASQYLNLTKNSSLAVAIAYPDLVAMGGTVNNQSGRAIEVVLIWMAVYLSLSLMTSAFMNWFNARVRLVER